MSDSCRKTLTLDVAAADADKLHAENARDPLILSEAVHGPVDAVALR